MCSVQAVELRFTMDRMQQRKYILEVLLMWHSSELMIMNVLRQMQKGESLLGDEGKQVESTAPRQVAEASSSGRSNISLSALSPDGKYLVLGDADGLQILRLEPSGGAISPFLQSHRI